jgi:NAD(P)-dependent dehydrogenase (short-subunit alcohol dehydrogenase family)
MATFDAKNKTFLITGGTSGVGRGVALGLARLGGKVVIVSRNAAGGEAAVREIANATGHDDVHYLVADLSDQASIRAACETFKRTYERLDCLGNMAGAAVFTKGKTVDGIDLSLAVNYLDHFVITNQLLDILKASKPARVITVSGAPMIVKRAKLDFDDLQGDKKYSGLVAAGVGLRARTIFTMELGKRLAGTGVTANAFHPGGVKSNLIRGEAPMLLRMIGKLMGNASQECPIGVYLAAAKEVDGVTAAFFDNKMKRVPAIEAYDAAEAERLWAMSEALTRGK